MAMAADPVERAKSARFEGFASATVGETLERYAHRGLVEWQAHDYSQLKQRFVQATVPLTPYSSTAQATLDGLAARQVTARFVYSIELRPRPGDDDTYTVHSAGISVQAQRGDGGDGRSLDYQVIDEARNRGYHAAIADNRPVDLLDLPDEVVARLRE